MKFDDVQSTDCMPDLAIQVADDIREHVKSIYVDMLTRSRQLDDGLPNVVLAGLTLVWLESVHNLFGSASYESAVGLLGAIKPEDKEARRGMRRAAADVLRRSGWGIKRRQA
jgi:hypothetical protein